MKLRKEPIRMCAACREGRPKKELARVVKSPDGEISVDTNGKSPGRGAYICRNAQCFEKARKAHSLERALECAIAPEIYDLLRSQIEEREADE
ncbi:MAG: YlxR family protein [Oscillospiraceae bacterium]